MSSPENELPLSVSEEIPADAVPAQPAPFPRPLGARRAFFILVMYVITQIAAVLVVMFVMAITFSSGPGDVNELMSGTVVIPAVIAALVMGGIVIVRLTRRSFPEAAGRVWLEAIGWTPSSRRDMAVGSALGFALALIYLFVVGSLFPPSENQPPGPLVTAAMGSEWARLGWAAAALFLAPPVEEFLFRGVLLTGFTRSWGPKVAVVLTIATFTALHYTETSQYLPGLGGIGLLATFTTIARLKTGSLKPAVAIHVAYNLCMVLLVYAWQG